MKEYQYVSPASQQPLALAQDRVETSRRVRTVPVRPNPRPARMRGRRDAQSSLGGWKEGWYGWVEGGEFIISRIRVGIAVVLIGRVR